MIFTVSLSEVDTDSSNKEHCAEQLSNFVTEAIAHIDYGSDVIIYYMPCICIKELAGYEDWFTLRKPSYVSKEPGGPQIRINPIPIAKTLFHEIRVPSDEYDKFVYGNDEQTIEVLSGLILSALSSLKKLPAGINQFNLSSFKEDMRLILSSFPSKSRPVH